MATNSVVSDDILIYNLVQESWMEQLFLVYEAATKRELAKIEDGRSIRKAFHAIGYRSEGLELKNEIYHEMQVRHLITKGNTRERANVMLAVDPQMFSLEPIGICKSCKNPQKLLDQYAGRPGLFICIECINEVVKLLIEESVVHGHTELVENQFRTHFVIDWIYEPNIYQFDTLIGDFFNPKWLNVVEDVFRKTILGDKPDIEGIHFSASFGFSALSR